MFLKLVAENAEIRIPIELPGPVSRDPDDDKFIACALAAGIKWIISGDDDLLSISGYQGLKIVTPAQFLTQHRL